MSMLQADSSSSGDGCLSISSSRAHHRPLVIDFLAAPPAAPLQVPPMVSSALSTVTLAPPPPVGPFLDLSPRRRYMHGEGSTPLSPYVPATGGHHETAATVMAACPVPQTPLPTPPTGLPLAMPVPSSTSTPTNTPSSSAGPSPTSRTLFFHSPYEVEPPRHSHRSGRLLGELESLHQKHESEFKVLVPAIGIALQCTLDAHEKYLATSQQHTAAAHNADDVEGTAAAASMATSGDTWRSLECDSCMAHYDTVAPPSLTIQAYVKRVSDFTYISPATLLATVVLVDRLLEKYPKLLLTPINAFKIFFVAARIASKVLDLRSLNNKNFASVGGVSNQHLNDLEAKMLMDLRFDLFISQELFVKYAKCVIPSNMTPPAHSTYPGAVYCNPITTQQNAATRGGLSSQQGATSPRSSRAAYAHVTFAVPPPIADKRGPDDSEDIARLPHPPVER